MAITSEIIGKLGGADVETTSVNRLIKKGDGFQVLHTITVDKPSLVAATLTHDNTDSFDGVSGRAGVALRGANKVHYAGSYGVSQAAGNPLSIAAGLSAGTWTIEATYNPGTGLSEYTVNTVTIVTTPL